MKAILSLFCL